MAKNSVWLLAVCIAAVCAVLGHAQSPESSASDPQSTFRSAIDLVRLDVSVLDADRQPIRGLTASDFTILEEGTVQPVVAFDAVDLPDWSQNHDSWVRTIAPDVVTNRFAAQRLIVILVDDFLMPSDPWTVKAAKRIAGDAVASMGPHDLAAVVYALGRNRGQEFTTDRTRLLAAIERLVPFGEAAVTNPFSASERGQQSGAKPPPSPKGGFSGACPPPSGCLLPALDNAAQVLREWPGGRKTVVLIGAGMMRAPVGSLDSTSENYELARTFAALQEANINVYQFDPRGLQVARPVDAAEFEIFADNTGGRAITSTNAPWTLVPQVFRENSSYYLLGFRSAAARPDGRFRRLTVQVSRRDAQVRARSGYYAPGSGFATRRTSSSPGSPIDAAVARGLPTGDLPMDLTVAPFAVPGERRAAVAIIAGVDRPVPSPQGMLDVVATAFRDDWKPAGAWTQQLEMAETEATGDARHYDIPSRLDLVPGRYEIRVAVHNRATGRTGSAYASVTVPDFTKDRLALSGVAIERGAASDTGVASPIAGLLPVVPTTIREFSRSDRASAFVRIYQGGNIPMLPAELTVKLVDEQNQTVVEQTSTIAPEAFGKLRKADYRFEIPLAQLNPAHLLLTIQVVAGRQSDRRDVRLTIK